MFSIFTRTPFLGCLSLGRPRASILTNHVRLMSMGYPKVQTLDPYIEWKRRSKEVSRWDEVPPNPYSGRSVVVGRNLRNAFKALDFILAKNKVRAQVAQTRRHEQKGAKRRRLSSQRWRKRFALEVRQKVQLVEKIRRRGA